jgi:regulator of CtrA degradation
MEYSAQTLPEPGNENAVRDLHFDLIEALYIEAMVLADEARAYFEQTSNLPNHPDMVGMRPMVRVGFSCESLKTTTRLMQIISWLLFQRAIHAGELDAQQAAARANNLGDGIASDADICKTLPDTARLIIAASEQLYARVARLQRHQDRPRTAPPASPVHAMQQQLETAF